MVMRFHGQLGVYLERKTDRYRECLRVLGKKSVVIPGTVTQAITACGERKARDKDHVEGAGVRFVARWMACTENTRYQVMLTHVALVFQHAALQGLRSITGDTAPQPFVQQRVQINFRTHAQEAAQHADLA